MSLAPRIFVMVATVGRAEVTRRTVDRLALQTRKPDGIVVVGAQASDIEGVDKARGQPEIHLGERGLCNQRNRGLDLIGARADVVIFFDDDYVAADDFVEQTAKLFGERPDLVGATGRLIADGVHGRGFTVDEGVAMIEADTDPPSFELPREALYGCNMIIRLSAAQGLRFDTALPLYGWQEDIDFTYQLGQRGDMVKSSLLRGVHLGAKGGRSPGARLGYSQIANPIYLLRKRTIPPALARRIMWRNLAANLARSLMPEPHIDRRGRAKGNLLAIKDLMLGRLDPRRILEMA
jgi:hypothetical protein